MESLRKKILITGANGLIGRELCEQLAINADIVGVDNDSRFGNRVPPRCKFVKQDLQEFLATVENNFDLVFHLAAINGTNSFYNKPNQLIENNVSNDISMFNFVRQNKKTKLVYASSSEIIADSTEIPTAEVTDVTIKNIHNPRWSYRLSKMLAENYLFNSDLDFLVVRFFNVYGKGSGPGHFVYDLMTKIKQENFELVGADETRSFCHVSDAVDAMIKISQMANRELINIGNDEEISILKAADIVASMCMTHAPRWKVLPGRPGSVKRRQPDITKLRSLYKSYSPKKFQQGIELSFGAHA